MVCTDRYMAHPYPQCCLMHLAALPWCAHGKLLFPHQLWALEAAAAAARREEGPVGKVLRSKDAAFGGGQGAVNHIPRGSVQDYSFRCLPGNILKPFTLRKCETAENTDETNKLPSQRN